ncbi:MAG: UDP-3-O-(3-hydroxymyristoyl)glucosamine N-acyltransferase, partial [Candidatus Neomarinimicrobiota bacterium]
MITLKELAEKVGGKLIGDESIIISSVDDIKLAKEESISFAFLPKYKKEIQHSNASAFVVLSERDLDDKYGIVVEDPYLSMISILDYFDNRPVPEKNVSTNSQIHNSVNQPVNFHIGSFSVIDKDTVIGENVFIGHGVKINPGCVIGDNSVLYDNVVIYDNTIIGKNCIINAGTVIGSDGFGYHTIANEHHKIPHIKSVIIGNDVEIGSACTIDRGSVQNTIIGDFCKFDNQVHIAHNVSIGKACLLAGGVFIGGSTQIEDYVTIAGKSDIGPHITLGAKSVIAARSCVLKSLPGSEMYAGNPARPIKEKQKRDAIYTRFEL